jgi:hypothetical protein
MKLIRQQTNSHSAFAVPLQPDTQLGLAVLIAEDEEGAHAPVGIANTIREAEELADSDFRDRMARLEGGREPGLCTTVYRLWARGTHGDYCVATEIYPR